MLLVGYVREEVRELLHPTLITPSSSHHPTWKREHGRLAVGTPSFLPPRPKPVATWAHARKAVGWRE